MTSWRACQASTSKCPRLTVECLCHKQYFPRLHGVLNNEMAKWDWAAEVVMGLGDMEEVWWERNVIWDVTVHDDSLDVIRRALDGPAVALQDVRVDLRRPYILMAELAVKSGRRALSCVPDARMTRLWPTGERAQGAVRMWLVW